MNRVVISATPDENYAPFLPITTSAWRAAGYDPLCLLVGKEEWKSPRLRAILAHTRDCEVVHMDRVPNVPDATLSQCSRLVACTVAKDDYLLTSDVDIFPLDKAWFNQQDMSRPFHVLGVETGGTPTHFCINYLGASSTTWQEVMEVRSTSPESAVAEMLAGRKIHWGTDEDVLAQKLLKWPRFSEVELIRRTNSMRVDRSEWPLPPKHHPVDCHCPRPILPQWGSLRKILQTVLDPLAVDRLDAYTSEIGRTKT